MASEAGDKGRSRTGWRAVSSRQLCGRQGLISIRCTEGLRVVRLKDRRTDTCALLPAPLVEGCLGGINSPVLLGKVGAWRWGCPRGTRSPRTGGANLKQDVVNTSWARAHVELPTIAMGKVWGGPRADILLALLISESRMRQAAFLLWLV